MNVTLSPETQKLLEDRLSTGEYRNADEALQAALAVLQQLARVGLDEETLDAVDRAEDQIERGEVHGWEKVRETVRGNFLGK